MRRTASIAAIIVLVGTLLGACTSTSSGLTGKTWTLTAITQQTPAFQGVLAPDDQGKYTTAFNDDSTFDAKADCNMVSGGYRTGADGSMSMSRAQHPRRLPARFAGAGLYHGAEPDDELRDARRHPVADASGRRQAPVQLARQRRAGGEGRR